ncbi:hypothetical protein GF351_00160 [Candidatus Woesearchaeota archaeon]|nr:hypothetical protein [Candidatus Woesearchaeota archaeon]
MNNRLWIFCILLLVPLFAVPAYSASLSISPGHTTLFFDPGEKYTVTFNAENTDHKEKYIRIIPVSKSGIEDIILLQSENYYFPAGSRQKITFMVKMPASLPPGDHDIKLRLMPTKVSGETGHLSAIELVNYLVKVYVPYPGKYLIAVLRSPLYNNLGEVIPFEILATNLGTQTIDTINASIDIMLDDELVDTIHTETTSIESKDEKYLPAYLDTKEMLIGKYTAVARIMWDGNITKKNRTFYIGDLKMEIINISRRSFETDKINKLTIEVENKWSEKIPNVYASVKLMKDGEQVLPSFNTQSVPVDRWATSYIPAYLDTQGMEAGDYDMDITLHYSDKTVQKTFGVSIFKSKPKIIPFTEGPSGFDWESISMIHVSIAVLALVVLVNVLWFVLKKKKKDEKGDEA